MDYDIEQENKRKELAAQGQAPGLASAVGRGIVDTQRAKDEERKKKFENVMAGGYDINDETINRLSDMNLGSMLGKREFSNDPRMQELEAKRRELAKGYSGEELAALRNMSRNELDAQRLKALQQTKSGLARGGVGGARAAAVQGAQNVAQQRAAGDTERKMLLDQGQMVRQGQNDLQDFLFRQKLGEAGYTLGMASLGSADKAAAAARAANSGGKK